MKKLQPHTRLYNNNGNETDCSESSERQSNNDHMDTSFLLEPMYQTSENASDTESGGNIYLQNDEIPGPVRRRAKQTYACVICNKIYRRKYYLQKHMRKHQLTKKVVVKHLDKSYWCHVPECNQTFASLALLRKHGVQHTDLVCVACEKRFSVWYDFQWHIASCSELARGQLKQTNVFTIRRTRSLGPYDNQNPFHRERPFTSSGSVMSFSTRLVLQIYLF